MPYVMPKHDYYEILQVHPKASLAVIKKAYRTLLLELGNHPDQGGDRDVAALITEAYGVLSHTSRRAEYDRGYFTQTPPRAEARPDTHREPPRSETQAEPRREPASRRDPQDEQGPIPEPTAETTSLIVLCPTCRTKNRVRGQALLAIAKCSRCGKSLSRGHDPFIEYRERARGIWHTLRDEVREARVPRGARPIDKQASAWARGVAVGIPLLLIIASLVAAGYAAMDMWDGLGDPVATAGQLEKEGKLGEAAVRLEHAVGHDPQNPRLFEMLGDVYAKQGDPNQALVNYQTAIRLNPLNSYYWEMQGGLLQQMDRLQEAELSYKRSLMIDPGYAPALVAMGNLEAKNQNFGGAVMYYRKALHDQPNADVLYNLGMVYQWDHHAPEAMTAFKQALVLDPANRSSMVGLAAVYYDTHQYDLAAGQLVKASHLKQADLELHQRLADIYERTGHAQDALREWNVSLDLARDNAEASARARQAIERLRAVIGPSSG